MLPFADATADLITLAVTHLAAACDGSVGLAIILASVAVRVALLPLTLRISLQMATYRRNQQRLQPELAAIQARHGDDPRRRADETAALYRRHGLNLLNPLRGLVPSLIQAPILSGFYLAIHRGLGAGVRFLGIANLGAPSLALALLFAPLAYLACLAQVPPPSPAQSLVMVLIVLFLAWKVAAALALHWASFSLVALVEAAWVRRRLRPIPPDAPN